MLLPLQVQPFDPQEYIPAIVDAATTLVLFLVVFVLIYLVGRYFVTRAVRGTLRRRGFDDTIIGLAVSTSVAVTAVVAIALAATIAGFGVVLAAFATLAGALALAVGFATKDLVANFVAGVFIIHDEPFAVGDWIRWADSEGVVREIHLRVTKVDTFDNEQVTVPNNQLANAAVTNPVANDTLRVTADFGISYDDDIEQARGAILEESAAIEGVLDDPAPSAPVTSLGDSAVVLQGRLWIDPEATGAGGVRAAFVQSVKERFDADGISFPYPNTEVSGGIEVTEIGNGTSTSE